MTPWLAARTRSRHEKFVLHQLDTRGIMSYLPLTREKRDGKIFELCLIPGYIFVKPEEPSRVLELAGVAGYVTFQSHPAAIPDSEIDILKMATRHEYNAKEYKAFLPDEEVRIVGTPFNGQNGRVESTRGSRVRVVLSTTFGKCFSVEIETHNLVSTGAPVATN